MNNVIWIKWDANFKVSSEPFSLIKVGGNRECLQILSNTINLSGNWKEAFSLMQSKMLSNKYLTNLNPLLIVAVSSPVMFNSAVSKVYRQLWRYLYPCCIHCVLYCLNIKMSFNIKRSFIKHQKVIQQWIHFLLCYCIVQYLQHKDCRDGFLWNFLTPCIWSCHLVVQT